MSEAIRNGRDAAFARAGSENRTSGDMPDGNQYDEPERGLTKREFFAAAALQGLMANPSWAGSYASMSPREVAECALKHADALLAALAQEGGAE